MFNQVRNQIKKTRNKPVEDGYLKYGQSSCSANQHTYLTGLIVRGMKKVDLWIDGVKTFSEMASDAAFMFMKIDVDK